MPVILLAPANTSAPLGSPLMLPCEASDGGEGVEIQWLRDQRPIAYSTDPSFDTRLSLFPNGTLLIKALQLGDVGVYTCILSAHGAFDTADAFIDVLQGASDAFLNTTIILLSFGFHEFCDFRLGTY